MLLVQSLPFLAAVGARRDRALAASTTSPIWRALEAALAARRRPVAPMPGGAPAPMAQKRSELAHSSAVMPDAAVVRSRTLKLASG